jgi:hypothetical protein
MHKGTGPSPMGQGRAGPSIPSTVTGILFKSPITDQ